MQIITSASRKRRSVPAMIASRPAKIATRLSRRNTHKAHTAHTGERISKRQADENALGLVSCSWLLLYWEQYAHLEHAYKQYKQYTNAHNNSVLSVNYLWSSISCTSNHPSHLVLPCSLSTAPETSPRKHPLSFSLFLVLTKIPWHPPDKASAPLLCGRPGLTGC